MRPCGARSLRSSAESLKAVPSTTSSIDAIARKNAVRKDPPTANRSPSNLILDRPIAAIQPSWRCNRAGRAGLALVLALAFPDGLMYSALHHSIEAKVLRWKKKTSSTLELKEIS